MTYLGFAEIVGRRGDRSMAGYGRIIAQLGVTKDTVYTWAAEKVMPAHKINRPWKTQASQGDDWVRSSGEDTSGNAGTD